MTTAKRRGWIIGAVIAIGIGSVVALVNIPGPLSNNWLESVDLSEIKDPQARVIQAIAPAAQTVLFAIGGLIALIGLALSLDRHALAVEQAKADREDEATRVKEWSEQRRTEQERELRARFVSAVELLSDVDKATTRQAGMYALAALADDWADFGNLRERDVCIEVMCGYLRSTWDPTEHATADDERRIRATGFNEIASHLRPQAGERSWNGAHFNLRKAIIDFDVNASEIDVSEATLDLSGATFSGGTVSFYDATFSGGTVSFYDAKFSGGDVLFDGAKFSGGDVLFDGATFSGGTVSFDGAKFSGGKVSFVDATFSSDGATFLGGKVSFDGAKFSGGKVSFDGATFSGGTVSFVDAPFLGGTVSFVAATFLGGAVFFSGAPFSGGTVSFHDATFSGGRVLFSGATFGGGEVSFGRTRFLGGEVLFDGATFSGGEVLFVGATFRGGEVSFFAATFWGGTVSFEQARFLRGTVWSDGATFLGGTVSFVDAMFEGTVDRNGEKFRGFGPDTPPPPPDAGPDHEGDGHEDELNEPE